METLPVKPTAPAPKSKRPKPTSISIAPARPEPVLKLWRETMTSIVGDPIEAERIVWVLCYQLAGTVVRMPTTADLARAARDEAIVRRLTRDPGTEAVRHTAAHFGLFVREAAKIAKARTGLGVGERRARQSSQPGLTCRAPRLNRWRRVIEC